MHFISYRFIYCNLLFYYSFFSQAAKDPLWIKYLNDGMKEANKKTESNAQIVQKWKLLPCDFSEKTGELTPTMKLKRSVVVEKYHSLIESLYGEDER